MHLKRLRYRIYQLYFSILHSCIMFFSSMIKSQHFKSPIRVCGLALLQERFMSQEVENKYNEVEKQKILEVMNVSNPEDLSMYEITKTRLKKFNEWKANNGQVKTLSDVELIDGFNNKTAKKLFDSILEGPQKKQKGALRIKGQFLHPNLTESVRQSCKSVLAVYIAVNSVCWALIDRTNYELTEWQYHSINYPDGKKFQITDILNIAWRITTQLPPADVYVMKAEATTLRAAGSDPNNPKVIAVNLQKAQLVAMIVALINARSNRFARTSKSEHEENFSQKVYFLRPTLPYRLYGTLVGNEKVSTEETVRMLLQNLTTKCMKNTHAYVPENLQNMFKSNRDLQKDMLGHCLLLGLTFMDVCIYKNQESINKLAKRGD